MKPKVKPGEIQIREQCQILEQQLDQGHAVRVTVIKGGRSANGYNYDDQALQQIAQLVEGAQAYVDHGDQHQSVRSVRDIIGFYKEARFIPGSPSRVEANLHIMESADWLWSLIKESIEIGKPDLIGLSIDIFGSAQLNEATRAQDVTRVHALNSCDIVTRPSAGGSINRILHHQEPDQGGTTKVDEDKDKTQTQDPPEKDQQIQENSKILEQMQIIEAQRKELEELTRKAKIGQCSIELEKRLQESILPSAAKEQIRGKFKDRIFESSELENEMSSVLTMLAGLAKDGIVRGHNYEKPDIGSQITEAEKIQAAFDAMLDLEIDTTKLGNIRGFNSIREAYARVTGDATLSGGISGGSQLGEIRVHESAPISRITESDLTTASFAYLLGTSMNKRLLKDYQAWPAEWAKFVTIVPIRDFKQNTRIRFGHFSSLSTVPEGGTYSDLSLQDSAATYVAAKRGNLVPITRETIINDDLQAVRQIPTKLAVAAAYTLAEFVYAFLTSNPAIYDGVVLFHSDHGSNTASNALSSSAMQTGVTAMRKQSNFASKKIGIRPRFLVVPPDLEFTAMVITNSAQLPGSTNNDINPMAGYTTPIVSPQISSTTAWYLIADPREIDTIEIGFVNGQTNPCLFIQDAPLLGNNFSKDVISYKIRHEYGGAVTDFRGLYRGNS